MIKRFKTNKLGRDISKILLGTGLGQVITFLSAPVLTRLYAPESFGVQSALLAIVSPLVVLTSMAFPIAIVVARNDKDAAALARLALLGGVLVSPLVTWALLVRDGWLLGLLSLSEARPYIGLIPVLVLAMTLNMSASHHMTRAHDFGLMARSAIAAAAVSSMGKIAMGIFSPGALALILGNLLGYLVPSFMARRRRLASITAPGTGVAHLAAVAREHRDFPLFRAPQNFIWALSQSLPVVFLSAGYGSAAAGHFAVAMAMAGAPVMLMGNSVQSVLYPRMTAAVQKEAGVSQLLWVTTATLFGAGLIIFVPVVMFGPTLFEMALGTSWREAGEYAALLSPWLLPSLAIRPALAVIPILKLQRGLLFYEILSTGLKATVLLASILCSSSARDALLLFSIAGGIAYAGLIVWVWRSERERIKLK